MSDVRVGIVGAGGVVGRTLSAMLSKGGIPFIRSSRRGGDPSWYRVDAYDPESVSRFARECDIVVNCSGPSFLTSGRLLAPVLALGRDYIDAFGCLPQGEEKAAAPRRVVLSCGCVPGFLEVLLSHLCGPRTTELCAWSGGSEDGSPAALGDIILSSISGYGTASAYADCGRVIRETADPASARAAADREMDLPPEAYVTPVSTSDIVRLSGRLQKRIRSYNIWSDAGTGRLIAEGCMRASGIPGDRDRCRLFEELFGKSKALRRQETRPWYVLHVKALDGEDCREMHLETGNSTLITAGMLFHSVRKLIAGAVPPGIRRPFEFADAGEMLSFLGEMGINVQTGGTI